MSIEILAEDGRAIARPRIHVISEYTTHSIREMLHLGKSVRDFKPVAYPSTTPENG